MSNRRRRIVVLGGAAIALLSLLLGVVLAAIYVRSVRTQFEGDQFAAKVADGVADTLTEALMEAQGRVEQALAENPVGGKIITLDELNRFRDLCVRGERDRVRELLRARYNREELEQLHQILTRLAEQAEQERRGP